MCNILEQPGRQYIVYHYWWRLKHYCFNVSQKNDIAVVGRKLFYVSDFREFAEETDVRNLNIVIWSINTGELFAFKQVSRK